MSNDIPTPEELLSAVSRWQADANGATPAEDRPPRLATVDAAYTGSGPALVRFDGETTTGARTYVPLVPVSPGDRVVMLPVGRTYVILGTTGTFRHSYTPAFAGFTLGNGTVSAFYSVSNGLLSIEMVITLGSTSVMGDLVFNLPVGLPPASTSSFIRRGAAVLLDVSVGSGARFLGEVVTSGATSLRVMYQDTGSAPFVRLLAMTTTLPFTWAAGDVVTVQVSYQLA